MSGEPAGIAGRELQSVGERQAGHADGQRHILFQRPAGTGQIWRAHDAEAAVGFQVVPRPGETEDVAIVHLATGWNAGQLKVGSFARSERMAKWNEGIRLETRPDAPAGFAGRAALASRS